MISIAAIGKVRIGIDPCLPIDGGLSCRDQITVCLAEMLVPEESPIGGER